MCLGLRFWIPRSNSNRRPSDSETVPSACISKLSLCCSLSSPGLIRHPGLPRWIAEDAGALPEETIVVTRMWRGWTRSDQADRYEQHYRSEVVVILGQVAGFRGARLLRRTIGAETEFVSLMFFEDLDAVRSFAGSDHREDIDGTVTRNQDSGNLWRSGRDR
jgi:heme-degrading monooxygenase HmoA